MDDKIEIRKVSKRYGSKTALDNVDLTIGKGMFGLLGRNGAGKTTLMKTLAALHPQSGGTIRVCGVPIEDRKKKRYICPKGNGSLLKTAKNILQDFIL